MGLRSFMDEIAPILRRGSFVSLSGVRGGRHSLIHTGIWTGGGSHVRDGMDDKR